MYLLLFDLLQNNRLVEFVLVELTTEELSLARQGQFSHQQPKLSRKSDIHHAN